MEKFWKAVETIGKRLFYISGFLLIFIAFLSLFSVFTAPLPLLKLITSTDIAVCILALLFLLVMGLRMVDVGKEESSYYNNMCRIDRRIRKVLTGNRVVWHLMK